MSKITPEQRLARMQQSFDKDYSVLEEDYLFFTDGAFVPASEATFTSDAPTSPSKAGRRSAKACSGSEMSNHRVPTRSSNWSWRVRLCAPLSFRARCSDALDLSEKFFDHLRALACDDVVIVGEARVVWMHLLPLDQAVFAEGTVGALDDDVLIGPHAALAAWIAGVEQNVELKLRDADVTKLGRYPGHVCSLHERWRKVDPNSISTPS